MKRRIYLVGFRVDGVKHVKEVAANNKQSAIDKFNKSNPNVPIESIIFSQ
jgi:hypothetical protein